MVLHVEILCIKNILFLYLHSVSLLLYVCLTARLFILFCMHVYLQSNFIFFFSPWRFTAFAPILLRQQTCSSLSYIVIHLTSSAVSAVTRIWIMFFPDIQDIAFSLTQCLQMQSVVLLFLKIFFISSFETDYQDGFKQPHLCFISALCGDSSGSHNLVSLSHFLSIFQVCSYWQYCIKEIHILHIYLKYFTAFFNLIKCFPSI